jgi:hypothetical protein
MPSRILIYKKGEHQRRTQEPRNTCRKNYGPWSWGQDLVGPRGGTMPGPIALKLRDLRAERGLTQEQAAELARVTP